jgi:hypothetical protein
VDGPIIAQGYLISKPKQADDLDFGITADLAAASRV